MSKLHSKIENIWWSKHQPPLPLRLIEPVYSAISNRHLRQRAAQTVQPPLPLISVGNITAGGSGKTPFVLWLAAALQKKGFKPVIICRGDGGNNSKPRIVESNMSALDVGDEARMLAELASNTVIVGSDRVAASQIAKDFGNIIILDDGFQYRHLARVCDIVLIPAEGIGNGHRIPAGPLREAVTALSRSDLIVRTGSRAALQQCEKISPAQEWHWFCETGDLIDAMDSGAEPPDTVYAATSIARPERFLNSLSASGLRVSGHVIFPDHHQFTRQEIDQLQTKEHVAITEKDAVKLKPFWPKDKPLWLLKLKGFGESGLLDAIIGKLPRP
ncbi:tetraacyldisaccharide 4'-kinase [Mariprofundus micogutta]|uniref:Tetraacyldisaccharide 4'-kinase n=1 Tax=Mariprofundus micogutta TaxID=1921010 RepID=A0A1L8CPF9_9PROT|nr:tetraacyldisaccharide 4'-kinase [Mariprofundus micogutta]GAV20798.1 tetraacyldisaccharide 4'-kinase [Mariprofundus micogutta]